MIFDPNFLEFIECLNKREAKYVLVGGLAAVIHGVNRVTGDMDIFIEASKPNASVVLAAIDDFGFGSIGFTEEEDVFDRAIEFKTDGVTVKVIHVNDLITNKESVGREKDIMDVKALKRKYKK